MNTKAPAIRSVGRALPEHYVDQETLTRAFQEHWAASHFNPQRLVELHRATTVRGRYLALPPGRYLAMHGFAAHNDAWIEAAVELGDKAIRDGLARAGLEPADVDHLFFVTVTGIASPGIDARLMNRLSLRPGVKRTPIFGLGCVAGAAGIARASDVLRAFPGETAVMLSVELCSLTLQKDDLSVANVISAGLFGDGAAAAVLRGGEAKGEGPRITATRSIFYPGTERVMGWDVVDQGFKIVLSPRVPDMAREHLRRDVDAFLADHGLDRGRIRHFVAHTGGPKVLEACAEALELPRSALERSWRSLAEVGNLSSASVLFVLKDLLESGEARPGDLGLLLAMGPGFCSELLLLEW